MLMFYLARGVEVDLRCIYCMVPTLFVVSRYPHVCEGFLVHKKAWLKCMHWDHFGWAKGGETSEFAWLSGFPRIFCSQTGFYCTLSIQQKQLTEYLRLDGLNMRSE